MTNPDLSRANWRTSSHSGGNGNGNCVEVAVNLPGIIAVRDSKNPAGPELIFSPASWAAFTAEVRTGDFNVVRALPARRPAGRLVDRRHLTGRAYRRLPA